MGNRQSGLIAIVIAIGKVMIMEKPYTLNPHPSPLTPKP